MLFCDMPLLGASLEVISTEKTFRNLTFFRKNYTSLILIVVKDYFDYDYSESLLLPQLLKRRKRLEAIGRISGYVKEKLS